MVATPEPAAAQLRLLALLVKQQRISLGYSNKEDAAAACGLSHMPYRNVEAGRSVSATTYAKIENGFKLRPGSCQAVLEGADSITLTDGTELIAGGQIQRIESNQLADDIRDAVNSAARLTAPDLTHRQTEAMTAKVIEELRKRGVLPAAS